MEPLFRLTLVRPAIDQDPENPSIPLAQDSPFQVAMAVASKAKEPREELRKAAKKFVKTAEFIGDIDDNPLSSKLRAFAASLNALERKVALVNADVVNAVKAAFGAEPKVLVQQKKLDVPMARLKDSILAIKQLQEEHGRPIEALTNQLRYLEVIVKVAQDPAFPATTAALRRYRQRSVLLPSATELQSALTTARVEEGRRKKLAEADAERHKSAEGLLDKYRRLRKAVDELTSLGVDHFETTPQNPHDGFTPPKEFSPSAILNRQVAYFGKLSELNLLQFKAAADRTSATDDHSGIVDPLHTQAIAGARSAAFLAEKILAGAPRPLAGSPAFNPTTPSKVTFRLKASASKLLSASSDKLLSERKLFLAEHPLDWIVETLKREVDTTGKELELYYTQPVKKSIKRIGDVLITIATPVISPLLLAPLDARIPHTRGEVSPAGVADLLIVKQQLIGYEAADVAHIENVLRGERKQREHTRRRETEELTFRETEITTSEERELESTNRFEMTRETNSTIKEDASLKAGLTISGKYGPVVEFSASAEGSLSRSKEESTKSAAKFSQDVTQRSSNKISERVLERASLRVTNEVIEKNAHELNNMGGTGAHISGVYQWVNKLYEAQMFNYGIRTIFDFMIPEPAAFLMEVMKSAHASSMELPKPAEFTLKPNDITDDVMSTGYYGRWAKLYKATDVTPPPEIYKTKSLDFKAGGADHNTHYNHSAQITIEEGYRAIQGSVGKLVNMWNSSSSSHVDVVLGRQTHRFVAGDWMWIASLNDERDSIPFILNTFNISQVAVAVEVKCQRTDRAMEKWRVETHAKLTTAYKACLAEYEEKLAALQLQAGVAIRGKNPALNLQIMKDELKKNCISILTDQHYDLFNAITIAWSNGLPEIDVLEAEGEGTYVRFFEQAFEWEHITWVTYPYFWGRKNQWDERLAVEDPDPLFNDFLKAGYCRVTVPGRPGFEGAIDHFMTHGELWNGGPLPAISGPLYLPIADEIAERLDQPGDEIPQGNPWTVRIPTTLVHLRADDKLPKWKKDVNGNWVEV